MLGVTSEHVCHCTHLPAYPAARAMHQVRGAGFLPFRNQPSSRERKVKFTLALHAIGPTDPALGKDLRMACAVIEDVL